MRSMPRSGFAVMAGAVAVAMGIVAAVAAEKPAGRGGALLPGSSGKEPISIDAGKLDYFDKDGKLVYSGDVVARQGTSTLKGSILTIFLSKDARKTDTAAEGTAGEPVASAPAGGSSIERMEVGGPVTVISKDEVGTGDNGSYEKAANKIILTGNVTLTQATNIIKGDKLIYDMTSGQAQVLSGQTQGRVRSVFTPGSGTGPGAAPKKARPAEAATARTP